MSDQKRLRIEQGAKRVRGYARGELVFETARPLLVWEVPYFPTYYIPEEDVLSGLVANGGTKRSQSRGEAELLDINVNESLVENGALRYPDSPIEDLRDVVRFEWNALD